jgi:acyl-CoA synthetase (AMP-forming)/AMP-acid ligase II
MGLEGALLADACRDRLPIYMLPAVIDIRAGPLPRNANGKIDRKTLAHAFVDHFSGSSLARPDDERSPSQ